MYDIAYLQNNALMDANFPYPMAFETAYNLAIKFLDALQLFNNLMVVVIVLMVLVVLTRILWTMIR